MWTENDQEVSDNKIWDQQQERPAVLWYPAILLLGALVSPWSPGVPSGFLAPCCLLGLSVVLLRI